MSEKKSSTVRRRVCRVAASMTIAGEQDTSVRVTTATTGEAAVAVRIGTMLISVEDTEARPAASKPSSAHSCSATGSSARTARPMHAGRSMESHAQPQPSIRIALSTGGRFGIAPGRPPSLAGLMTNYLPDSLELDDTVDEVYQRWLDNNGFPAMRQPLADHGRDDVVVLRSLPDGEALGTFHAVSTRDGEARARDGQPFTRSTPWEF